MPVPIFVQGHQDGTATYYEWHPQGENVPWPELTADMERMRLERKARDEKWNDAGTCKAGLCCDQR